MITTFEPFRPKIQLHIRTGFLQSLWDKYVPVSSKNYDRISLAYLNGTFGEAQEPPKQVQLLVRLILNHTTVQNNLERNQILVDRHVVNNCVSNTVNYYLEQLKRVDFQMYRSLKQYLSVTEQAKEQERRYQSWEKEEGEIQKLQERYQASHGLSLGLEEFTNVWLAQEGKHFLQMLFQSAGKKEYEFLSEVLIWSERKWAIEYIQNCTEEKFLKICKRLEKETWISAPPKDMGKNMLLEGGKEPGRGETIHQLQDKAPASWEGSRLEEQKKGQDSRLSRQRMVLLAESFGRKEFRRFYQRVLFLERHLEKEETRWFRTGIIWKNAKKEVVRQLEQLEGKEVRSFWEKFPAIVAEICEKQEGVQDLEPGEQNQSRYEMCRRFENRFHKVQKRYLEGARFYFREHMLDGKKEETSQEAGKAPDVDVQLPGQQAVPGEAPGKANQPLGNAKRQSSQQAVPGEAAVPQVHLLLKKLFLDAPLKRDEPSPEEKESFWTLLSQLEQEVSQLLAEQRQEIFFREKQMVERYQDILPVTESEISIRQLQNCAEALLTHAAQKKYPEQKEHQAQNQGAMPQVPVGKHLVGEGKTFLEGRLEKEEKTFPEGRLAKEGNIRIGNHFLEGMLPLAENRRVHQESKPEGSRKVYLESGPEESIRVYLESEPEGSRKVHLESGPEESIRVYLESEPEGSRKVHLESGSEESMRVYLESEPEGSQKAHLEGGPEGSRRAHQERKPEESVRVHLESELERSRKAHQQREYEGSQKAYLENGSLGIYLRTENAGKQQKRQAEIYLLLQKLLSNLNGQLEKSGIHLRYEKEMLLEPSLVQALIKLEQGGEKAYQKMVQILADMVLASSEEEQLSNSAIRRWCSRTEAEADGEKGYERLASHFSHMISEQSLIEEEEEFREWRDILLTHSTQEMKKERKSLPEKEHPAKEQSPNAFMEEDPFISQPASPSMENIRQEIERSKERVRLQQLMMQINRQLQGSGIQISFGEEQLSNSAIRRLLAKAEADGEEGYGRLVSRLSHMILRKPEEAWKAGENPIEPSRLPTGSQPGHLHQPPEKVETLSSKHAYGQRMATANLQPPEKVETLSGKLIYAQHMPAAHPQSLEPAWENGKPEEGVFSQRAAFQRPSEEAEPEKERKIEEHYARLLYLAPLYEEKRRKQYQADIQKARGKMAGLEKEIKQYEERERLQKRENFFGEEPLSLRERRRMQREKPSEWGQGTENPPKWEQGTENPLEWAQSMEKPSEWPADPNALPTQMQQNLQVQRKLQVQPNLQSPMLKYAFPENTSSTQRKKEELQRQEEAARMESLHRQLEVRVEEVEQKLKQTESHGIPKENVRDITEKVKKQLHEELHMERLRRGLL